MTIWSLTVAQESRNHQLTIRIPRRVRRAIDARAERERRSVADIVNNILEQHFPAKEPATKDQGRRR
jgi:predicted HicB family RNase H-like nuclease